MKPHEQMKQKVPTRNVPMRPPSANPNALNESLRGVRIGATKGGAAGTVDSGDTGPLSLCRPSI